MCSIMGFTKWDLTPEETHVYFDRTKSRGPDSTRIERAGEGSLCFHRLSIMGLEESGMQPFLFSEKETLPCPDHAKLPDDPDFPDAFC